jgi:hypothetical protein
MVKHTISALNDGDNIFYIHVDANSNADFSMLKGIPNVFFSEERYKTSWSTVGDCKAILHILNEASEKSWDYVCFLSETDCPTKSVSYISEFLKQSGKDHIRCTPLPHNNPLRTPSSFWEDGGRPRYEKYAFPLGGKDLYIYALANPHFHFYGEHGACYGTPPTIAGIYKNLDAVSF